MGKKRYEVEAARSGLGSCISYLQSKINTFLLAPNSVTRKKRSQSPHVSASKQISARSSNRPVVRTCVRLSTHTHTHTIVPHALTKKPRFAEIHFILERSSHNTLYNLFHLHSRIHTFLERGQGQRTEYQMKT